MSGLCCALSSLSETSSGSPIGTPAAPKRSRKIPLPSLSETCSATTNSPSATAATAGFSGLRSVAPDGAFVVAFRTPADDIAAREYDRACRPVGAAFTVNTATAGIQTLPDVASSNDRFAVVWRGLGVGGDADGSGVARRLFLRRSLFSDPFEDGTTSAWSAVQP